MTLSRRISFTLDGRRVTVVAEEYEGRLVISINGEKIEVMLVSRDEDEIVLKTSDDRSLSFAVERSGSDLITLWLGGIAYRAELLRPYSATRRAAVEQAQHGVITCPFPGKVIKLMVDEGAVIDAGQPLAVLESMKTEIMIGAPHRGIVKKIHIKPGQSVAKGQLLIELEP
ncbi:MAG: hypothetical protein NXY59_04480 [Aigarchaeota archaeon]|nr:hypothetical protein [Candidatus Pelearchaeum maunauluense]